VRPKPLARRNRTSQTASSPNVSSQSSMDIIGFVVEKSITIPFPRTKSIAQLRNEIECMTGVTHDKSLLFIEEDRSISPLPLPQSISMPILEYMYTLSNTGFYTDFRKSPLHTAAIKGSYLADEMVTSLLSPEKQTLGEICREEDFYLSLECVSDRLTLENLLNNSPQVEVCDFIASQIKVCNRSHLEN
jgi:hypothetical protein